MNRFKWVARWCAVAVAFSMANGLASAQTKISIGYAAVSPRTTPLYLAQEQGIFTKYGLDPKIVLVRAAATLVATLVTGEMDVGYTGGTSVIGAAGQGSQLKILSSIATTLTHTLIAHPSFKRAEELRGKRFGIQNPGGTTWINTILALEHVGLDYKRDNISLLQIGDSVLVGQALEAGRVDAAVLDGALVRRLRAKGFTVIAEMQPAKIPVLSTGIVVAPEFLQKRGDIAEKRSVSPSASSSCTDNAVRLFVQTASFAPKPARISSCSTTPSNGLDSRAMSAA